MDLEKMTEEQVLKRLLEVDTVPHKTVLLERLGIPIKLKGLTGKQVYNIRERCTERREKRGQVIERIDNEQFNTALVASGTVSPNWANDELIAKFNASGPEEVIKRLLLAGELSALGDEILDLSGFNTELEEL